VTVGDGAGKGVSAALLMARMYSDIRYMLLSQPTPAQAITQLNRNLSGGGWGTGSSRWGWRCSTLGGIPYRW